MAKKVLFAGKGDLVEMPDGAKLIFHYEAKKPDGTVIDDSRKSWPHGYGERMEIVLGKKFKLPIWETCLKTMRVGEVAEFKLEVDDLFDYPMVSKQLRDICRSRGKSEPCEHQHHSCAGVLAQTGLGYAELDALMKEPQSLTFTFELLQVLHPDQYEPDSWQLKPAEKLQSIPQLRAEGNRLYQQERYSEAIAKYSEALGRLDSVSMMERPGDSHYEEYRQMGVPIYANLAQCHLKRQEYYEAINCCNSLLDRQPDHEKGMFRRADAYAHVYEFDLAIKDYRRLAEVHPHLSTFVAEKLAEIERLRKETNAKDQLMFSRVLHKTGAQQ